MSNPQSLSALAAELEALRELYPMLKDDELFVLWFVMAYLVDDPGRASDSLAGGSGDKGVDAVHADHDADRVAIVQGKYSAAAKGSESRSDLMAFADLASILTDADRFSGWLEHAVPDVAIKMREAHRNVAKKGYRLDLYYVTTRRCSNALRADATSAVKASGAALTILQGKDVLNLLADYLDGVAPPVPLVELPVETAPASGEIKRYDSSTGITAWMLSARARDVAALYEKHGTKIFARNIRGYLGQGDEHSVNSAIRQTLRVDPSHFWYFNNGVTIACDGAERIDTGGKLVLRMKNPQIVNGQQTTVTLARADTPANASVVVRVIALPKNQLELIDQIVTATNRQNPIRASDLMSTDRIQVFLERKLRLRGYHYLRKRADKSSARAVDGSKARNVLTKFDLAQAVAACDLEPEIVRSAREGLFDDATYPRSFPKQEVDFYLTRWWLLKLASRQLWGQGAERGYMKYFIVHDLWRRLGGSISSRGRAFVDAAERNRSEESPLWELTRSIDETISAVARFFSKTRREDEDDLSVYVFFKRRGQYREYGTFMRQPQQKALRERIKKADTRFEVALQT